MARARKLPLGRRAQPIGNRRDERRQLPHRSYSKLHLDTRPVRGRVSLSADDGLATGRDDCDYGSGGSDFQ